MAVVKRELERDVQKKVLKYLKATLHEGESFFWKVSERYASGIPDIMGFYRGKGFAIELKVGNNKPTELQKLTMVRLRSAGVTVAVCYSVEEVKQFMEREIL